MTTAQRRQPPVRRARPVVGRGQRGQLVGVAPARRAGAARRDPRRSDPIPSLELLEEEAAQVNEVCGADQRVGPRAGRERGSGQGASGRRRGPGPIWRASSGPRPAAARPGTGGTRSPGRPSGGPRPGTAASPGHSCGHGPGQAPVRPPPRGAVASASRVTARAARASGDSTDASSAAAARPGVAGAAPAAQPPLAEPPRSPARLHGEQRRRPVRVALGDRGVPPARVHVGPESAATGSRADADRAQARPASPSASGTAR